MANDPVGWILAKKNIASGIACVVGILSNTCLPVTKKSRVILGAKWKTSSGAVIDSLLGSQPQVIMDFYKLDGTNSFVRVVDYLIPSPSTNPYVAGDVMEYKNQVDLSSLAADTPYVVVINFMAAFDGAIGETFDIAHFKASVIPDISDEAIMRTTNVQAIKDTSASAIYFRQLANADIDPNDFFVYATSDGSQQKLCISHGQKDDTEMQFGMGEDGSIGSRLPFLLKLFGRLLVNGTLGGSFEVGHFGQVKHDVGIGVSSPAMTLLYELEGYQGVSGDESGKLRVYGYPKATGQESSFEITLNASYGFHSTWGYGHSFDVVGSYAFRLHIGNGTVSFYRSNTQISGSGFVDWDERLVDVDLNGKIAEFGSGYDLQVSKALLGAGSTNEIRFVSDDIRFLNNSGLPANRGELFGMKPTVISRTIMGSYFDPCRVHGATSPARWVKMAGVEESVSSDTYTPYADNVPVGGIGFYSGSALSWALHSMPVTASIPMMDIIRFGWEANDLNSVASSDFNDVTKPLGVWLCGITFDYSMWMPFAIPTTGSVKGLKARITKSVMRQASSPSDPWTIVNTDLLNEIGMSQASDPSGAPEWFSYRNRLDVGYSDFTALDRTADSYLSQPSFSSNYPMVRDSQIVISVWPRDTKGVPPHDDSVDGMFLRSVTLELGVLKPMI
ncbi:MAG: hypothetical protein DRP09_15745 [Candidatus Thorarchaeota archaeon]|nr:MAG: hypothetical protein DRP09_15745 [Candidatus Thorarchaeota archaeon]